jgi:hypothetical protein
LETLAASSIPWQVVANTPLLQAVTSDARLGAVFYAPGEVRFSDDQHVEALDPCIVLIERSADSLLVHVSDPTQSLDTVRLRVPGASSVADGPAEIRADSIEIRMPGGLDAGSSVRVHLVRAQ